MTQIFDKIVQKLSLAGIDSPRLEARLILAAAKKSECAEISAFTELNDIECALVEKMLEQRLKHKPLDKILGHREFYKYDFLCNENVLSPRSDTEILVEQAAKLIFKHNLKNALELGIGSGCILLSLLADFPFLCGTGVDISKKALEVAKKNAENLDVDKRLNLRCADWNDDNFVFAFQKKFEIIVSNPPYIPSDDIAGLAPEVREFDPIEALDGGKSGFAAYERIAKIAPSILAENGFLLFESGYNQAHKIAEICEENGFEVFDIEKDLAGIERCIIAKKKIIK